MPYSETLYERLGHELVQRGEEGCDVVELKRERARIRSLPEQEREAAAAAIYDQLSRLPLRPGFPYDEPSTLEGIRDHSPGSSAATPGADPLTSNINLHDRVLGAWLGRIAGCMLGKPVEGLMGAGHQALVTYLKDVRAWPLDDYVPWREAPPTDDYDLEWWSATRGCCRGQIQCGERDDDTDHTLLGLHILEKHGADFRPHDVAAAWLAHLPFHRVFTAERVAYRNLIENRVPPDSATYRNPYREWIGAQIRADGYGYACPGQPARAAEFAFRDASVSHVKNGVYGEMWVAAMVARALVTDNLEDVLDTGLEHIPRRSRLAEAVGNVRAWARSDDDWQSTYSRIQEAYGHYHPVHTINNAAVVTMALCHGALDYSRTICIAVMGGWDTDCNGATAGSIAGALLGARALPKRWTEPLNDTLRSAVCESESNSIIELAARTVRLIERLS